jgi:ABC-type sugar transport system ATPase subunit
MDLIKQNKILIFITSDMEELLSMSDRVLVMREGKIAAEVQKKDLTQRRVLKEAIGGEEIA